MNKLIYKHATDSGNDAITFEFDLYRGVHSYSRSGTYFSGSFKRAQDNILYYEATGVGSLDPDVRFEDHPTAGLDTHMRMEVELIHGHTFKVINYSRKQDGLDQIEHFKIEHPYAINTSVILSPESLNTTVKDLSMLYPMAVFRNMITPGISVSNTRIAMLHINGAITDLVNINAD